MTKPYVYLIKHKTLNYWYIGSRSGNRVPANEDTGYWGSSQYLPKFIFKTGGKENWEKLIVDEFDTQREAFLHEQKLLNKLWNVPGRINVNRKKR